MKVGIYAPKPNMGASTLARQLAMYVASKKQKVLLVELDFRYPSTAVEWGMADFDHCLECSVADYRTKSGWKLEDYLLPKDAKDQREDNQVSTKSRLPKKRFPANLHMLIPSGLRGFENFPEESDTFLNDLFYRGEQLGFEWVVLDISSEVDSLFTLSSLKEADVCVAIVDDQLSNHRIMQHRFHLFKGLGLPIDMISVTHQSRPRISRIPKGQGTVEGTLRPIATFPFVPRLWKPFSFLRPSWWGYRRALQKLFRSLTNGKEQKLVDLKRREESRIE